MLRSWRRAGLLLRAHVRASEPVIDEVDLVRRQGQTLATAPCNDEVPEPAREQRRRNALLEPWVALADHIENEANVIATDVDAMILGLRRDRIQRLRPIEAAGC